MNNLKIKTIKLKSTDNFGKRFKECRQWRGLTQKEIVRGNITRQTFSRFEKGNNIMFQSFLEYAKGLGIRNIKILLRNIGDDLTISPNDFPKEFKEFRKSQGFSKHDLFSKVPSIYHIEEKEENDFKLDVILGYAKALRAKILIINIV